MMGVLGGRRGRSCAVCVCVNKCVNAWSMSAYASVFGCIQHVTLFSVFCMCVCVCVDAAFTATLLPSQGECGWCCGWFGDSKCMVPQSLRPLNYLSSSP